MVEISTRLTATETAAHTAKQARRNKIVLSILITIISAMLVLSFWHVSAETNALKRQMPLTTE